MLLSSQVPAADSRERMYRMFRQAPGFICALTGPDHVFEFVNNSYLQIFGRPGIVGMSVREAFPELKGQGFFELLDGVFENGVRYVADAMPIRFRPTPEAPEQERFLNFIYEPLTDEDGSVIGVFCEGFDVTEQRRSAAALRESEQRYRAIVEGAHDFAIATIDQTGIITSWNTGAEKIVGLTSAEALGENIEVIFTPEDRAVGMPEQERQHARTLGKWINECWLVRRDGNRFWGSCLIMELAEGGFLKMLRDATAEHQAKDELQVARAAAEALATERTATLGQLTEGVIVTDATGRITFVNEAAESLHGVAALGVEPANYAATYHLFDEDGRPYPAHDLPLARAVRGEVVGEAHWRIRRPDGTEIIAVGNAHPIRSQNGTQTGAVLTLRDDTQRRVAEQALRELNETLEQRVADRTSELLQSRRRFQGIFDSALQFMALLRPDGTVVEVNRTALQWSQIEPSDIIGKPFWLAAPMRDNAELQAAIKAGIYRAAAGETVREEHEMRGAGELRATVDFSLKPVPGDDGEPAWLVAEGRDVTELKKAQEALRQSQKLEAMGQLTGGVAHDVNNLLSPIVGSLDFLQRRELGGEREQRLIAGALQSAERVRVLIQRLLAFARRQPLQPKPVNVGALVAGMADLVASTSGPRTKVEVDLAGDLPAAVADPNQLEMAILNLSVNARDAMPEGGRLTISGRAESIAAGGLTGLAPGRYVRLSVADTGCGMDEETLKRAVEPFYSTKGVGKGTGLGLSMAHGLAAQLGGLLTIESRPNVGTNVELWLPATDAKADAPETLSDRRGSPTVGTALLVDDEELVRASTAEMLADLGFAVSEAGSAEEALRLIEGGLSFDVLVTDHLMPGMSGTDLAREVVRQLPRTRVLIVSGFAEVEAAAPDLPRLVKPFRQSELASMLSAPLENQ